jgi:hypothetical protein
MRKLSLAGGLVLALATAASAFAAGPSTQLVAATSHKWTTSFKDGAISVASTLTATSKYSSGKVAINVKGATGGEKLTITFFDRQAGTPHVIISRTVTAGSTGRYAATWTLTSAELKAMKALPTAAQRELRIRAASKNGTGMYSGK